MMSVNQTDARMDARVKSHKPWYESVLTDDNGEWDVGNIGQFALTALVVGVIPFMCGMVVWSALVPSLKFDPQPLGIAVGAVCGGFATAIGGLGAYRRLADNKTPQLGPSPAPPPPPVPQAPPVVAVVQGSPEQAQYRG